MNRPELEGLDRDDLIARAEAAGVKSPRFLTRPELVDELLLRGVSDQATKQRVRGLFGRARDLLARVVERGLHLPEAADRIRSLRVLPDAPAPSVVVPTVTLAEIYASQGHRDRAVETLDEVLSQEPDHAAARVLAAQLRDDAYPVPVPRLPPEKDDEARMELGLEAREPSLEAAEPAPSSDDAIGESSFNAEPTQRLEVADAIGEPSLNTEPTQRLEVADAIGESPLNAEAAQRVDAATAEPSARAEPAHALDDATLPTRYDVDECVAIPVDPSSLYIYWEVRALTFDSFREARPGGTITLRLIVIVPTWDGPSSSVRDADVRETLGNFFACELPAGCVVRAAIGYRVGDAFVPIAHSPALETPPGAPSPLVADSLVRWTPQGLAAVNRTDVDARSIERAVVRVRRDAVLAEREPSLNQPSLGSSERWVSTPAP